MTPFDGGATVVLVARKGSKPSRPKAARKPKSGPLGSTAAEIYQLAERILGIRDRLAQEIAHYRKLVTGAEANINSPDVELRRRSVANAVFWGRDAENLEAHRARFEARLVVDPVLAVCEVDALQPSGLFEPPSLAKNAVRDLRLKRAVEAAYGWLRYQDHREPDDGLDRHPKHKGFFFMGAQDPKMVLKALNPIATARPLASMKQLHALSLHATVKARLETEGHKHAAIALVALASGEGEQTVKRAAGS